tara:strand:+ start:1538 stop:3274 length:1737 start_codon:yes stop_codon:yes gene_type:complete
LKAELPEEAEPYFGLDGAKMSIKAGRMSFSHLRILDSIDAGEIEPDLLNSSAVPSGFCQDHFDHTEELDTFLMQERSLYFDKLQMGLTRLLAHDDDATGVGAARVLVRLDATNEMARRHIMRGLAETGEPASAIREFEDLQQILEDDYDVEPSAKTIDLVANIKMGRIVPRIQTAPAMQPNQQSAQSRKVLPVICIAKPGMSDTTKSLPAVTSFLADLISVLVRFREWTVAEATPSGNLDADFDLSVEIIHDGAEPIIVVLLKEKSTGRFVWSENLELSFKDWRHNHLVVVQNVASAIESNISRDRLMQLDALFPSHSSSFDLWVYCRNLINIWRPERFDEAVGLMQEIAKIDPEFAPARVELAALYNARHLFRPGEVMASKIRKEAAAHAHAAVQLDPLDAKAQRVLGFSELMNRRFESAHFHLSRAVNLNSADALTLMSSALGLMFCGDKAVAMDAARSAMDIRQEIPAFLRGYLVTMHTLADQNEEAVHSAALAPEGIQNIRGWEAIAHWRLDCKPEAARSAARFLDITRENWHGDAPPTANAICRWFAEAFPIKDKTVHRALVDDLRAAMNHPL